MLTARNFEGHHTKIALSAGTKVITRALLSTKLLPFALLNVHIIIVHFDSYV